jgi:hypothetical protein
MLCQVCSSIDFSSSDLQFELDTAFDSWDSLPDNIKPSESTRKYHASPHHLSLEDLFQSGEQGCHFCIKIRSELFNIRGHESNEDHHQGSLEVRYYPHAERVDKNKFRSREIYVVAKTPIRDVKLAFDFAQYNGKRFQLFT